MTNDATKLRLPIMIAVGMLGTAAAAGMAWAQSSAKLSEHSARIEHLEKHDERADREEESHRLRTQKLEDTLVNMGDMVKEIRQDVKDLKRGNR